MAPGGRVFKQTTLTGKTIQDNESNNVTPAVNTDNSTRIRNDRGKTRGKGLEKMKKAMESKMKIEIPVDKEKQIKPVQSAKLFNELGIIARNFLPLPKKWKKLTREDKDAALLRCHDGAFIQMHKLHHMHKDGLKASIKQHINQHTHKFARKTSKQKGENKHEKVEPDRIQFYKHTHYTIEKGWSFVEAETHYNNMIDLKDVYASGESSMTIDEIVDTVLGTKSGYIKKIQLWFKIKYDKSYTKKNGRIRRLPQKGKTGSCYCPA